MTKKIYDVPLLPDHMVAIIRKYAPKKPKRMFIIRKYGEQEEY